MSTPVIISARWRRTCSRVSSSPNRVRTAVTIAPGAAIVTRARLCLSTRYPTASRPRGCPAPDRGGGLPTQVGRVLQAGVQALPAEREVDVRRVTGEEHPPVAVA